jgi:hypothetical protein
MSGKRPATIVADLSHDGQNTYLQTEHFQQKVASAKLIVYKKMGRTSMRNATSQQATKAPKRPKLIV